MFAPLGDTGSGKMGDRPPTPQPLNEIAATRSPSNHTRLLVVNRTAPTYIGGRLVDPATLQTLESESERGQSQKASLCRRVQPISGRRLPALRSPDRSFRRPLPQLRIQAVAVERDGLSGVQGLASGRSWAPRAGVAVRPRASDYGRGRGRLRSPRAPPRHPHLPYHHLPVRHLLPRSLPPSAPS